MAIREILKMGEPLLLASAAKVSQFDTAELHALIQDMHETMQANQGVGIAAPQIGVSLQVVIFGFAQSARYPDASTVPYTVLINPVLTALSDDMEEGWEGCLSVPGLRGSVPRYTQLRYEGFDAYGQRIERVAQGFHARVVQHECDHLNGVLYPQRIRDLRLFGYTSVLFPDHVGEED